MAQPASFIDQPTVGDPADVAGIPGDLQPFVFLARASAAGLTGALVTICAIDGGAPKPLGEHMAVLSDGRHVGQVSGGCVEPAIAAEVAAVITGGKDAVLRFGKGSSYFDIRFPCGGGVDLLVHVAPDPALLDGAIDRIGQRRPFSIAFDPSRSSAALTDVSGPTRWTDERFVRRYLPRTRLLLVGRGPDVGVVARVAAAAGLDLALATPDDSTALMLAGLDAPLTRLQTPGQDWSLPIDPWTATVLLFHEHEWETAILARAVAAGGFYVGALGSVKTHRLRCERLAAHGVPADQIARIRGPIGLVDRARDAGTLALSVLAEIAAGRNVLDRA